MSYYMTDQPTEEQLAAWERRAPGWVVRCLRCGLTQPWGKYGIRIAAASIKKCTIGRCPRCKRICCHVIEKRKPDRQEAPAHQGTKATKAPM